MVGAVQAPFARRPDSPLFQRAFGIQKRKGGVKELMLMIRKSNLKKEAEPEVKNRDAPV